MHHYILCARHVLLAAVCNGPGPIVASELTRDLAAEVRAVLNSKCAGCHGAHLAKPEGRFGYVLDLARLAANPEIVIPSFPNESEIWELVRREEMPPEDSPTGPLSQEDKDVIHGWIAAGAPAGGGSPSEQNTSPTVPIISVSAETVVSHSPESARAGTQRSPRNRHRSGNLQRCHRHSVRSRGA